MSQPNPILCGLLRQGRVIVAVALFLSIAGAVAWMTMPREEDPRIPDRFGIAVIPFPGADASSVERLILGPVEDELAAVSEVKVISSTARADVAVVFIELADSVTDTARGWDLVEDALDEARADFPEGVGPTRLDDELVGRQDVVVLAITGSTDPQLLRDHSETVRKRLLTVPGVAEVNRVGDPERQVTIELDDVVLKRYQLSAAAVAAELSRRNQVIPAGALTLGDQKAIIIPGTEFATVEEIRRTPILLAKGSAVALGELGQVRLGGVEPASELMRHNLARGVVVTVVSERAIDTVALGSRIRDELSGLRDELAPLELVELSFQPDYVRDRLSGLSGSLLLGVGIVAGILFLTMGFRLGLTVALVVPLVALASLALYWFGGGVLQQLSVAALILSLGLLVDNAIVVVEATQHKIDAGLEPLAAAAAATRELAFPLATATGTTLAAFVPMLLANGPTGDFTRAIPIVAMLTLSLSYVFAITFTPVVASRLLKRRPRPNGGFFARISDRLAHAGARHPLLAIGLAFTLVGVSVVSASGLRVAFFPNADRDQFIIEVELPEGSDLEATSRVSLEVEHFLARQPDVTAVSSFVGRSAPRFYYNIPNRPSSPHFANLLVAVRNRDAIASVSLATQRFAQQHITAAEVITRRLAQGPPIEAPVEIRIYGDDLAELDAAARAVTKTTRAIDGTRSVRSSMGLGRLAARFEIDDAAAARHGLARSDVALALLKNARGLPAGRFRGRDKPIDIVVRSSDGENMSWEALLSVELPTRAGSIPIGEVARVVSEWQPAALRHRNTRRMVSVLAQLDEGVAFGQVAGPLQERLAALQLPPQVTYELGGEKEGSEQANKALGKAAPFGVLLLILCILVEFNSFRRLLIIVSTIPLAATGIVPGLLIANQPFGFMSLLGVFALVGLVVNNAIVLLSVVESRRKEGATVETALADAVRLRTRPILLTTATTVAGLMPWCSHHRRCGHQWHRPWLLGSLPQPHSR